MKLVFALYKYFPFGGLQKDMLALAEECAARGHEVSIFCRSWAGELPAHNPANIRIKLLPDSRLLISNHSKNRNFGAQLRRAVMRSKPDIVLGFNKIPGVDVYYAADTCFKSKLYNERPWFYRWLPRYRSYVEEESKLFAPGKQTHILAIAQPAIDEYIDQYHTEPQRFTLLPPGISRNRINTTGERLYALHGELGLGEDKKIVLMVGSGFRTKGLDRAINAVAALPAAIKQATHLVIAGEDNAESFMQQANQLGIKTQVHFLGGRKDVPQLLRSADVLIHPAYRENTGTVLLEAAVACTPVITTDVCGYSHYIRDNGLGIVLPSPFEQQVLNNALQEALASVEKIKQWRNSGRRFAQIADIYDMPKKAVDVIEALAKTGLHA
jgi:UDP-glucose:(heptosyl)LPS alpha-1,3-glucosyltransferase